MAENDRIELRGLRVMASVGVLPEERERAQPLELDLTLSCDLAAAGYSDALDDTVDYGAIMLVRPSRPVGGVGGAGCQHRAHG